MKKSMVINIVIGTNSFLHLQNANGGGEEGQRNFTPHVPLLFLEGYLYEVSI